MQKLHFNSALVPHIFRGIIQHQNYMLINGTSILVITLWMHNMAAWGVVFPGMAAIRHQSLFWQGHSTLVDREKHTVYLDDNEQIQDSVLVLWQRKDFSSLGDFCSAHCGSVVTFSTGSHWGRCKAAPSTESTWGTVPRESTIPSRAHRHTESTSWNHFLEWCSMHLCLHWLIPLVNADRGIETRHYILPTPSEVGSTSDELPKS